MEQRKLKPFDIKKGDTIPIRFYIEAYLMDIMRAFAKEEEMPASEIVNCALDDYFKKQGCNHYFYK